MERRDEVRDPARRRELGECARCGHPTRSVRWLNLLTGGCKRCATLAWQRLRVEHELEDDGRWTVPHGVPEKQHLRRVRRWSKDAPINKHLAAIYAEPIGVAAARCEREYQ